MQRKIARCAAILMLMIGMGLVMTAVDGSKAYAGSGGKSTPKPPPPPPPPPPPSPPATSLFSSSFNPFVCYYCDSDPGGKD